MVETADSFNSIEWIPNVRGHRLLGSAEPLSIPLNGFLDAEIVGRRRFRYFQFH